jgi:hypothetical protein
VDTIKKENSFILRWCEKGKEVIGFYFPLAHRFKNVKSVI